MLRRRGEGVNFFLGGTKEVQEAMKAYHDIVDHSRREIYVIEQ